MPFDGEFARYRSVARIADSERVQALLKRSQRVSRADIAAEVTPQAAPAPVKTPDLVLAIDGSYSEAEVQNGYPGAAVGYVTIAGVLIDLALLDRLDETRPADPRDFRRVEEAQTIDAALPGRNVVPAPHASAVDGFRHELFETLRTALADEDEPGGLLATYEVLLALKPPQVAGQGMSCPHRPRNGCDHALPAVGPGLSTCPVCAGTIYSTDALRLHERFSDDGTNGETFGQVSNTVERILAVHLLRLFERRGLMGQVNRLALLIDGAAGGVRLGSLVECGYPI